MSKSVCASRWMLPQTCDLGRRMAICQRTQKGEVESMNEALFLASLSRGGLCPCLSRALNSSPASLIQSVPRIRLVFEGLEDCHVKMIDCFLRVSLSVPQLRSICILSHSKIRRSGCCRFVL